MQSVKKKKNVSQLCKVSSATVKTLVIYIVLVINPKYCHEENSMFRVGFGGQSFTFSVLYIELVKFLIPLSFFPLNNDQLSFQVSDFVKKQ